MNEVFTHVLTQWGKQNRRSLPWVGQRDPYRVWLSEVILQQTRVEQGLPYYQAFTERFPNVHLLAAAPEDQVFKTWEGLGYYSRARNLIRTARVVYYEYGGIFPSTYEGLRALPGVGEYTAAAIASFCFDLPCAVLDGNVYRVLARYFGIGHPTQTAAGKKAFRIQADAVLNPSSPGAWNQAIMDFGSVQCKPKNPLCSQCPLAEHCIAYQQDRIAELPHKKPKSERRTRYFHYFVLENEGSQWVRKREGKDIWADLYEFPLVETTSRLDPGELMAEKDVQSMLGKGTWEVQEVSPWYRQALSHQDIQACFVKISSSGGKLDKIQGWQAAGPDQIRTLAFPRIIARYLNEQEG